MLKSLLSAAALLAITPSLQAQTATDSLRTTWINICTSGSISVELATRCNEIYTTGPTPTATRELQAAQGNNLETLTKHGADDDGHGENAQQTSACQCTTTE